MQRVVVETVQGPQGRLALEVQEVGGPGLPVLLLHADAGERQQWDEVVDALTAEREASAVARFDFRGHGASAAAEDGDYSFLGRGDDVGAVVRALGWDRLLLVAHSGGSGAAIAFAAAHPEPVAGLLLVDPPSDPAALPEQVRNGFIAGLEGDDSLAVLQAHYRSIAGDDEAVVARVLDGTTRTSAGARAGLGRALLTWDAASTDAVTAPIRIIGRASTDGPAALYRQRPALPHVLVGGTGHWAQIERPEVVLLQLDALRAG